MTSQIRSIQVHVVVKDQEVTSAATENVHKLENIDHSDLDISVCLAEVSMHI